MQLDKEILKPGALVHHLLNGTGIVTAVTDTSATAMFGKQLMTINAATINQRGVKMFGLDAPLIVWRDKRHPRPFSAYAKIIEQLDDL